MLKLDPKLRNILVAMFLVMGFWGYVHLIGAIIRAFHYHQLAQVNPYNLTRINNLLGHAGTTWWGFVLGWCVFVAGIAGLSWYLSRRR